MLSDEELGDLLAGCWADPNPFDALNETVLNSVDESVTLHDGSHPGQFWSKQRDICAAVADDSVTTIACPAGHSVGKSFSAARIIVGWLALHPESLVVSTGPSNTQIEEVLWKEVRSAYRNSHLNGRGRLTANPQKLDFGDGHHALGYSTNSAERLQGHHAKGPVLVVVDEASGVEDPDIWATLTSLKPRKRLLISNPLRPSGPFYDVCQRAADDPAVRLIRIPSLDSPDIEQEHSERGLADASWLREMRAEYGEGSLVWKVRVLAQFPDDATDAVFLREWVEAARKTPWKPAGPPRTALDLALGNGGDHAVITTRDNNGVILREASREWSLEKQAKKAKEHATRFGVEPYRISFDVEGIGADFAHRLEQEGLRGCQPYRGGGGGSAKFFNLRAAAAWAARNRLNPDAPARNAGGVLVRQEPFSLARLDDAAYRLLAKELLELRYEVGPAGEIKLERAEDYAARLKRSPDDQSAFCQSFAFSS